MKHFFLVANSSKQETIDFAKKMVAEFEKKGATASYIGNMDLRPEAVPEGTECVFVLGGDGTLIRTATRLVPLQIPVLGVNLGHLGYLCELEEQSFLDSVDRFLIDDCFVEQRMMLTEENSPLTQRPLALNDVVIHGTEHQQFVHLAVSVNGEPLTTYHADGIIISTPTGSTGYNMSAGGPIVDPKAKLILLTPINDHNLGTKCIVLDGDDEITVEMLSRNSDKNEKVYVSFDGDMLQTLKVGEQITIKRAKESAKVLRLNRTGFLDNLRKKLER